MRQRGLYEGSPDLKTRQVLIEDVAVHHNSLGTRYEDEGRYEDAYRHYLRAVRLAPRNEEFPYNAGNASFRAGRPNQAMQWYKDCLSLNPRYVDAWYNLGVVQAQRLGPQAARAAFEKVQELDPGRPQVENFLGLR
jgi:superkiller protein 3